MTISFPAKLTPKDIYMYIFPERLVCPELKEKAMFTGRRRFGSNMVSE